MYLFIYDTIKEMIKIIQSITKSITLFLLLINCVAKSKNADYK